MMNLFSENQLDEQKFFQQREKIRFAMQQNPEEIPLLLSQNLSGDIWCESERPLVDFRVSRNESPSVIECSGVQIVYGQSDIPKIFVKKNHKIKVRAEKLKSENPTISLCHCDFNSERNYYECDPFTTRTLVRYAVEEIFRFNNLPHVSELYYAFHENGIGRSYYEMFDLGSFTEFMSVVKLDRNIIFGILQQLIVIFTCLRDYNYNHGTASSQSILLRNKPVCYEYRGLKVKSDYLVQLSDMWHSSITYSGNHFFEKAGEFTSEIEFFPDVQYRNKSSAYCGLRNLNELSLPLVCPSESQSSCTSSNDFQDCDLSQVPIFKLGIQDERFLSDKEIKEQKNTINANRHSNEQTGTIYYFMRHYGLPLFTGAFDMYCIFTSMMCIPEFYKIVVNDSFLNKVWQMIWSYSEFPILQRQIAAEHVKKPQSMTNYNHERQAVDIISGKCLRCDVLEKMFEMFLREN